MNFEDISMPSIVQLHELPKAWSNELNIESKNSTFPQEKLLISVFLILQDIASFKVQSIKNKGPFTPRAINIAL